MAYTNTFIQIAPDSECAEQTVPTSTRAKTPQHIIQYNLLMENPYQLTHKDLVFEVYIRAKGLEEEAKTRRDELWHELHAKEHACLRASTLMKKFGWGAHYDEHGKIALYGVDSDKYAELANPENGLKQLLAMRSKRAK